MHIPGPPITGLFPENDEYFKYKNDSNEAVQSSDTGMAIGMPHHLHGLWFFRHAKFRFSLLHAVSLSETGRHPHAGTTTDLCM